MSSVLAAHGVGEGAAVGLCLDPAGHLFLAVNTPQVPIFTSVRTTRLHHHVLVLFSHIPRMSSAVQLCLHDSIM